MKFGDTLLQKQIPEWKKAYLNYQVLKLLLKPYKTAKKMKLDKQLLILKSDDNNISEQNQILYSLNNQITSEIFQFKLNFDSFLIAEIEKINAFYQYKLLDCMAKWREIKINKIIVEKMQKRAFIDYHKEKLKNSFQIFYKEVVYVIKFVEVNSLGIKKIIKKTKKFRPQIDNQSLLQNTDQIIETSYIQRNKKSITQLKKEVEEQFIQMFYPGPGKQHGQQKLRQIVEEKQIPQSQVFVFGLFTGFSFIILGWVLILFWAGILDPSDKNSSNTFSQEFPMFRGAALLIIANWLIAFNVYGWTSYHVNYKLIFKFGSHYSEIPEILKRAALFTTFFLIWFVIYSMILTDDDDFSDALDWIPKDICPLIVWLSILIYYLSPMENTFNYKGRAYMWKLVTLCFIQPFGEMEFRISWLTDQFISLVGAFKDLEYTICYWFQKIFGNDTAECTGSTRPTGFLLSLVPLYLRAVQCVRTCYDDKKKKVYKDYISNPQMINLGKYMSSIITSILSYLTKFDLVEVRPAWLFFAIFSTIYSFVWDLKKDWGLLIPGHQGLRPVLQYRKRFYYFAIFSNFILRLVWVLSISPDIIDSLGEYNITTEIFTFFVYFLESLRRCQWNFFRVENEHVKNFANFKAVSDLGLPMCPYMEPEDENTQNEEQQLLIQNSKTDKIYYTDRLSGTQDLQLGISKGTSNLARQNFNKLEKMQRDKIQLYQNTWKQNVKQFQKNLAEIKKQAKIIEENNQETNTVCSNTIDQKMQ